MSNMDFYFNQVPDGQPYWMIERIIDGQAHWWCRKKDQFDKWDSPERWTTDAAIARKYESKAEADYVIGADMIGCYATEHINCSGPDLTKGE